MAAVENTGKGQEQSLEDARQARFEQEVREERAARGSLPPAPNVSVSATPRPPPTRRASWR
ncbi:hypothetical protein [Candidatus Pantoea persica]|uniref:hypothetical protein n=1 Tax=Candidatus Pantoea persica TaxID=2518128 RepID=UPI00215D8325|nr:hypothetical protein [Candidatus Pantoea persica]